MQGLSPAESQERPSRCDGTAPKRINPYPERSEVSPTPNGSLPKATIFCISGSIGTAHRIYHTFFRRRCKPAFLSCDSFHFPSICKNVLSSILLNDASRRLCVHLCTLFLSYLNDIGSARPLYFLSSGLIVIYEEKLQISSSRRFITNKSTCLY